MGTCSLCEDCNCNAPPFDVEAIDCAAYCTNTKTICDAEPYPSCLFCVGALNPLASFEECVTGCEQDKPQRAAGNPWIAAEYACRAQHDTCAAYEACFFAACVPGSAIEDAGAPSCATDAAAGEGGGGPGGVGDPCVASSECHAGSACYDGQCLCLPGLIACGKRCRDLATDPRNCGGCGHKCLAAQPCCTQGACTGGSSEASRARRPPLSRRAM